MLVLTRKVDQGIVIAGNIYIRVLGVERDRVKIGIAAPKEIPVLRQELLELQLNGILIVRNCFPLPVVNRMQITVPKAKRQKWYAAFADRLGVGKC